MIELFEFNVTRQDESTFSDEEVSRFINDFLEPRGLFWGGGGDSNSIHGVISTDRNIGLDLLLGEFTGFFNDTDRIVLKLITGSGNLSYMAQLKNRQNVTFEPYVDDCRSD
jgi:hypothetical protein